MQNEDDPANFRIDYDGTWHHDGEPIRRAALVDLFAKRALKRDKDGQYWLSTPHESYRVEVADVPFIITDYSYEDDTLTLTSNLGESVVVSAARPLELRYNEKEKTELPYIMIRDDLYARLSRNVYYALIHRFGVCVSSQGKSFKLGNPED